jgi:fibronectin type 3 domain-containing protein
LSWHPSQDEVQGYNIYRTAISHASYQKVNSALLDRTSYVDSFLNPDTVYYYVVTSVDGQGRESNNSEEVRDNENNK